MQKIICPLCGSERTKYYKKVQDTLHFIPGEWTFYICKNCGAGFISNPPDTQGIQKYYPTSSYYTHQRPKSDNKILREIYDYYFSTRRTLKNALLFQLLHQSINMFPKKTNKAVPLLLDYGCGNGMLLQRYSSYGFCCEGYDVDENALKVAREMGFVVSSGDENVSLKYKRYDVIILNQVLEHLHNPIKTISFLRNKIQPDGELIISVPNFRCIDRAILQDSWTSFQAPTHLFHYNAQSLRKLLKKAGFSVCQIRYSSSLATLLPEYIRSNVKKLFRHKGRSTVPMLRALVFIVSSILSVIPIANQLKKTRITVYCKCN